MNKKLINARLNVIRLFYEHILTGGRKQATCVHTNNENKINSSSSSVSKHTKFFSRINKKNRLAMKNAAIPLKNRKTSNFYSTKMPRWTQSSQYQISQYKLAQENSNYIDCNEQINANRMSFRINFDELLTSNFALNDEEFKAGSNEIYYLNEELMTQSELFSYYNQTYMFGYNFILYDIPEEECGDETEYFEEILKL